MTPAERRVVDALLDDIFDPGPLTPAGRFWLPYAMAVAALVLWLVF